MIAVKGRHTGRVTIARHQARTEEPSTRRSPGRPPVPLDRIVAAALRIVDEDGADALSMRSLAQALDSGTATLYRHFANRAELITQVVDRVFGEAQFDAEGLAEIGWQQACQTVARGMFDALSRHRNVAPLLVQQLATGPNAMTIRERCVAVLLDGGFAPALAARTYATLARYVLGFAIQLANQGDADTGEDTAPTALLHPDPIRFPATAAVADSLPVPLEDEFTFGLELLLRGLDQLHGNKRRTTARRSAR